MADQLDVNRAAKAAVDEYKERVKIAVKRATCDLMTDVQMTYHIETLTTRGLVDTIMVLNGELHQLKQAVLEVK